LNMVAGSPPQQPTHDTHALAPGTNRSSGEMSFPYCAAPFCQTRSVEPSQCAGARNPRSTTPPYAPLPADELTALPIPAARRVRRWLPAPMTPPPPSAENRTGTPAYPKKWDLNGDSGIPAGASLRNRAARHRLAQDRPWDSVLAHDKWSTGLHLGFSRQSTSFGPRWRSPRISTLQPRSLPGGVGSVKIAEQNGTQPGTFVKGPLIQHRVNNTGPPTSSSSRHLPPPLTDDGIRRQPGSTHCIEGATFRRSCPIG